MNKALRNALIAGAAAGVAVGTPALINTLIARRVGRLDAQLPGDIGYYDWTHGRVAYYRMGLGEPLLLVHNPNAGGNAWEWRKVFPDLANRYTVFAIDLLGYGLSDKPNIAYTGVLFAELLHDFLEDVIGSKAHAIGSALGASYLVNVAARRPEAIDHLVLVNPLGCTQHLPSALETATQATLRAPLVGTSIYNSIVSRHGIERELRAHDYFDPDAITPQMVEALYEAAHQPGARYAVAAFASGRLDLPMRLPFSALTQPTMLVYGSNAYYTPVADAADLVYRYPQARLTVIQNSGMLPHDEEAGDFLYVVNDFLASVTGEEQAA